MSFRSWNDRATFGRRIWRGVRLPADLPYSGRRGSKALFCGSVFICCHDLQTEMLTAVSILHEQRSRDFGSICHDGTKHMNQVLLLLILVNGLIQTQDETADRPLRLKFRKLKLACGLRKHAGRLRRSRSGEAIVGDLLSRLTVILEVSQSRQS